MSIRRRFGGLGLGMGLGGGGLGVVRFIIDLALATCTRATTRTVWRNSLLQTVAINTPAMTDDSLSVEDAATNLVLWSEDFSQAVWAKTGVTSSLTTEVTVPIDGAVISKVIDTAIDNRHRSIQGVIPTGNSVISLMIKQGTYRYAGIMYLNASSTNEVGVVVDLDNGTIVAGGVGAGAVINASSISNVGNDWYKVDINITASVTGNITVTHRDTAYVSGAITDSFLGVITDYAYITAAEVKVGSVATSYIATTTATVTRDADINTSVTPDILDADWALEVEFDPSETGQTGTVYASYTDANNYVEVSITATTVVLRKRVGGVNYDATFTYTHTVGTRARTQCFGGAAGTGIRVADSSADITAVVFQTNADTTDTVWASGINWGHLNGTLSFVAEYYNVSNPTGYDSLTVAGWS